MGFRILQAPLVGRIDLEESAERLWAIASDAAVYVSIDVDVMDPAFAPGTPEPGDPRAGSCWRSCGRSTERT
jgi:arginase family enzyme